MRQVEAEEGLARREEGEVHGEVGRRAGVRLDVGVLGAEERLRPLDGQALQRIDEPLPLVEAGAGVALGVLVGEDRARGLEHRARGVVLAGDEAERLALVALLGLDEGEDLGIGLGQGLHAGASSV